MYNINDITQITNLEPRFIRKCLSELSDIFTPYITRGGKNEIIVDNNGFIIFDKIKQLKEKNFTITEIKKQIEKDLISSNANIINNQNDDNHLIKIIENQIKEQEIKNQRIIELEQATASLKTELRLLTDGKTFEEKKREWEEERKIKEQVEKENKRLLEEKEREKQKQIKKERLIDELYNVGVFSFWKRKKIYEEIKKLDG